MPHYIALGLSVYEKSVTSFFTPSVYIWRPRGPPVPKFTNLGDDVVQQGPRYQAAKIRLFR